ncbi:LysM peptidoglycan-binding domain-containing protein [Chitinivorax sp. PXF-14]|uniref:type IV pilus assembly protein FimV n=1 Tax=Chitinivorax sp. PXF-14 TaxID=3230488 RepID=UPI003464F7F5
MRRYERPTIATLAVLPLLALSQTALATATLGPLQVRSYLQEPFDASISFSHVELSGKRELFGCFELDRSGGSENGFPVISNATLSVEGSPEQGTLRIATPNPVTEPVALVRIKFRCDANADSLREYTFFLDPAPQDRVRDEAAPVPPSQVFLPVVRVLATKPKAAEPAAETGEKTTWTVRKGDTLQRISRRYQPGSKNRQKQLAQAIIDANPNIRNPDRIRIGQALVIPELLETREKFAAPPAAKAGPSSPAEPPPPKHRTAPIVASQTEYRVKLSATKNDADAGTKDDLGGTGKPSATHENDDKTAQLLALNDKIRELEAQVAALQIELKRQSTAPAAASGTAAPAKAATPRPAPQIPVASTLKPDAPVSPYAALGIGVAIAGLTAGGLTWMRKRRAT